MKKLSTILFLLISYTCFSQFGIHAAVSTTWFGGPGNQDYTGIKYAENGITGGVQYKLSFSKKSIFFIQPELNYSHFGAKNPQENRRKFSTYGIQPVITAGVNISYFTFEAGAYFNRMIYARNNDYFGPTFGWSVKEWDYYTKKTWGAVGSVSFDFIGSIFKVTYLHGLTNLRTGKNGMPSYNDPKMYGNQDRGINVGWYYPFKQKVYKRRDAKPHRIKQDSEPHKIAA